LTPLKEVLPYADDKAVNQPTPMKKHTTKELEGAASKEKLIYSDRRRWEIALKAINKVSGVEQWERRDGSYICDVGQELQVSVFPKLEAREIKYRGYVLRDSSRAWEVIDAYGALCTEKATVISAKEYVDIISGK